MAPRSRTRRPNRVRAAPRRDRAGEVKTRRRTRSPQTAELRPEPAPSARYTPSRAVFRIRPLSHKVIGWVLVGLGVAVAVLNDVQWASSRLRLLPGGHSELYLMLALAIAAYGSWWLGLFDRPNSP